jgi:hypothetical protein
MEGKEARMVTGEPRMEGKEARMVTGDPGWRERKPG